MDQLPFLQGDIHTHPEPRAPEPDPLPVPLPPETTVPLYFHRTNINALELAFTEETPSKDAREAFHSGVREFTDQIDDTTPMHGIFLRHRSRDLATTKLTEEKRLILSTRAANEMSWSTKLIGGTILFENLIDAIQLPKLPLDEELLHQCDLENQATMMARDLTTLQRNAERSDPDWPLNQVHLFLKNQVVKKLEKINSEAKPGQLIVSFRTQMILEWGKWARYITHQVLRHLPDHIFLNLGKTPQEMEDWIMRKWNLNTMNTDGDYTAYDTGQDASFTNMETLLMEHLSFPKWVIDGYKEMKNNLISIFGHLAVMRFTGEVWTFIFNTLGNIAYSHTKYDIPKGTPQMYGGDDKSINAKLKPRPSWRWNHVHYNLVEKQEISEYSTFCGWILSPYGLIKNPALLFLRTRYMVRRYDPELWAANYYDELVTTLRTGVYLERVLTAELYTYLCALPYIFRKLAKCTPTLAQRMRDNPMPY